MATRHIVSERALIGRVRRKLARENRLLTVARRGTRLGASLGRYIICDAHTGNPEAWRDDLTVWGRELGVMHTDEEVAK